MRGPSSTSRWMRIGRTSALASVLILVGSSAYAGLSLGGGDVRHEPDPNDASVRYTTVGFRTWAAIVPAPDFPEVVYREIRASNGEWIRDGFFDRRARSGFVLEDGAYKNGRRDGTWTFWTPNGGIDADRSGFYAAGCRVAPATVR